MATRKMITMNPKVVIKDDTHFVIDAHHVDHLNGVSRLWYQKENKYVQIANYRLAAIADAIAPRDELISFNLLYTIAKGYEVHHINGDHMDNRLSNLVVITKHDHKVLHQMLDDIMRQVMKSNADNAQMLIEEYHKLIHNTKEAQRENHNVFYG